MDPHVSNQLQALWQALRHIQATCCQNSPLQPGRQQFQPYAGPGDIVSQPNVSWNAQPQLPGMRSPGGPSIPGSPSTPGPWPQRGIPPLTGRPGLPGPTTPAGMPPLTGTVGPITPSGPAGPVAYPSPLPLPWTPPGGTGRGPTTPARPAGLPGPGPQPPHTDPFGVAMPRPVSVVGRPADPRPKQPPTAPAGSAGLYWQAQLFPSAGLYSNAVGTITTTAGLAGNPTQQVTA